MLRKVVKKAIKPLTNNVVLLVLLTRTVRALEVVDVVYD